MSQAKLISKEKFSGHARRAQVRLQKAMKGSSNQDVLIQAAVGAAGTMIVLRILRLSPVMRLVSGIAPALVFATIFSWRGPRNHVSR